MAKTQQMQNIRNKVRTLIDNYGNAVTLTTEGTESFDAWGEPTASGTSSTVTVGVTDQAVLGRYQITSAGRLKDGELLVLVKDDETVDDTYTVTFNGQDYAIMNLEEFRAADVLVALQLIVASK